MRPFIRSFIAINPFIDKYHDLVYKKSKKKFKLNDLCVVGVLASDPAQIPEGGALKKYIYIQYASDSTRFLGVPHLFNRCKTTQHTTKRGTSDISFPFLEYSNLLRGVPDFSIFSRFCGLVLRAGSGFSACSPTTLKSLFVNFQLLHV